MTMTRRNVVLRQTKQKSFKPKSDGPIKPAEKLFSKPYTRTKKQENRTAKMHVGTCLAFLNGRNDRQ